MKTTALALGFFDGVHLAHRAVLRQARDWADAHGCAACAVTFSVHPAAALAGKPQMLMQTLPDRIERQAGKTAEGVSMNTRSSLATLPTSMQGLVVVVPAIIWAPSCSTLL